MIREIPIAPKWHTAALVALIVTVAVVGTLITRTSHGSAVVAGRSRVLEAYVPMLVVTWALTFYVCRIGRATRTQSVLRHLIGRGWDSIGRAAMDVALAVALALVIEGAELAFAHVFPHRGGSVVAMRPHGSFERAAWVLVAVSVGFCEEVIYRGYLQAQLIAFTKRAAIGVVLAAVLFGIAHVEQGLATAARFAVYGTALGAVAFARRTLIPGILCHIAIDVAF